MTRRAQHRYNIDGWETLLEKTELSVAELAKICGFNPRHVYHILNGEVTHARTRTKRNVKTGLRENMVEERLIDNLFF